MNKNAFIDFDGTIVFVYKKYYYILKNYVKYTYKKTFKYYDYIKLKLQGYKDHEIINKLLNIDISIENYHIYKTENLENPLFLKYDKLIPYTKKALKLLKKKGYFTELLSCRISRDLLHIQLSKFKINSYFDKVTTLIASNKKNVKADYIKLNRSSEQDIIIGDSPIEMEAARMNNICGIFVETGLFNTDSKDGFKSFENLYEAVSSL